MDRANEHSGDGSDVPATKRPRIERTASAASSEEKVPQSATRQVRSSKYMRIYASSSLQRMNLPLRARVGHSASVAGGQEPPNDADPRQTPNDSLPGAAPPVPQVLSPLSSVQSTTAQASQVQPPARHPGVQPSEIHVTLSLVSIPEPVYLSDSVAQSLELELEALNSSVVALRREIEYRGEQILALEARMQNTEAANEARFRSMEAAYEAHRETTNRQMEEMRAMLANVMSRMDALDAKQQRAGRSE